MKPSLLCLLLICSGTMLRAQQEDENKIKVSPFTAQFLVSGDFKRTFCFNMVGAGIKYTKKDMVISLSLFPTLTFREDEPVDGESKKPYVRPTFALGPLFQYKRMMIGFPSYYQDDAWHFSAGVGIKIGN